MRQVATAGDEATAKLFADVLCARCIDAKVQRTRETSWAIWVLDEEHVEASRELWSAFESNPSSPEYAAVRGTLERQEGARAAEGRRSRHRIIDMRRRFGGPVAPPRVTFLLVIVSALTTAVYKFGNMPRFAESVFIGTGEEIAFGKPFFHVFHGEPWRVVTPIFLHLNFLHFLFNMWWLVDLGSLIERRIGSWLFSSLVFTTAVVSNVCQYAWTGSPYFGGMSGVIYALFGYVWMRGRLDPRIGFFVPPSVAIILLVWLAVGFTGQLGPVANITHLSGLIAGGILGVFSALVARR